MSRSIVIGPVRTSFFHCFEPKAPKGSEKLQYSTQLLIKVDDKKNMDLIAAAIEEAELDGKALLEGVPLKKQKRPLKDGEEDFPGDPNYVGIKYLNASNTRKPDVVKKKNGETITITDEEEAYSGMYVFALVNFFAFNKGGGVGIGCSLQHILKAKDGRRLDGRIAAAKAFENVDFGDTEEDEEEIEMRESRATASSTAGQQSAAPKTNDAFSDDDDDEEDPFA